MDDNAIRLLADMLHDALVNEMFEGGDLSEVTTLFARAFADALTNP